MSRQPPFPNRTRNAPPSSYSQDSRPDSFVSDGTGVGIPTRPSRSELRRMPSQTREGGLGESRISSESRGQPPARPIRAPNRESVSTASYSDREVTTKRLNLVDRNDRERERGYGRMGDRDGYARERGLVSESETSNRYPNGARSPISPEEAASPGFQAAIAALQSAGTRRAATRNNTLQSPADAYGGFMSPQGETPGGFGSYEEMEREERERRKREQARADVERRERMREREQAAKRGTQNTNGRPRRAGIDAVLDEIQGEWEWVTKPDFNPVELALSLLDESSVGKDMESFIRTKRILARAMKGTIETYAQTLAAALPHHAAVMGSLDQTHTHIKDTRTKLLEAKELLGNRRADLAQLWTRGQTLEEMIKMIDEIEYLKSVPDTLESLISEKRLLQASSLLIRSIKKISKADMQEIGALSDLKAYLAGQETTIRDILVDELQAHMYLKTFWCDTRWQAYIVGQQLLPMVEFDDEKPTDQISMNPKNRSARLASWLHNLNLKANDFPHELGRGSTAILSANFDPSPGTMMNESSQANPESDSFSYMETILESLAILGKLCDGLEMITQRLPMELYSLVEATIDEVNERTEFSRRILPQLENREDVVAAKAATPYFFLDVSVRSFVPGANPDERDTPIPNTLEERPPASLLRYIELENSISNTDHEILRDLFWTLYSKMDAVGQSMRVVYEVADRIGSRKDFKDASGSKPTAIFPFPELWEPIETELRTLILLYLNSEKGGASTGKMNVPSIHDSLQSGKTGWPKAWQNFRFGESDAKVAGRLNKSHEEELNRILKDSVPGLIGGAETSIQTALATAVDDRFASAVPHRLLVSPTVFHISVLFHPTLAFLDRAADVLPSTTSERVRQSSGFLDDFVLRAYLPQLEEKVANLFLKTVSSPDAFLPDPYWRRLSSRPLVRSTIELMALVNSLCAMQQTTPFHRDNYSRLILGVVIQFYQRCSDRFRELVSTREGMSQDDTHVAVAARWAQKLEVAACVSALYSLQEDDVAGSRRLCRQETRVELNFLTTETVNRDDLVPSKNLHALGNLFHSLIWFMRQLMSLRTIVEDPLSPTLDSVLEQESAFTATTPHFPLLPPAPRSDELKIPLTRPMALRFDALMRTYEQLAEYILATLRIDTRCRTIHFLDLAMRRGNYRVERDAGDPDPHIMDLNLDLGVCDDCANETLPPKERKFVFEGLGTLMEHLLISNARHIRFANAVGVKKIMRNMLAMQQNMKTITNVSQDADFERAKVYYGLFALTPREMLATIKRRPQFTLEEYKAMLNFQCGVDQAAGEKGTLNATDRNYHTYVTELHALAIEESTE